MFPSTFKPPPVRRHYQLGAGSPVSWVSCTGALLDPTHVLTAGHCVNQSR